MHKVTPFLWFDSEAEQAARYYVSIFKNAKLGEISGPKDKPLTVAFELDGQPFVGLNGGEYYKFSEAVSFQISCEDQAEVDWFWDKLLADGGQPSQCGWLKDRWGVSWQVTPKVLPTLIGHPDPAKAKRAMDAMMKMVKLDIATLEAAVAD